MKIIVDKENCEAQAICVRNAPKIFEIGEDDIMQILVEEIPEDQLAMVRHCVERCPKQALSIVE